MKTIEPMKAKKTNKEQFEGCIFEEKYDGGRIIAYKNDKIHLYTKRSNYVGNKYPYVREELKQLPEDTIIDGEIVVYNKGISDFENYLKRANTENSIQIDILSDNLKATYMVFDIIQLKGEKLIDRSLMERKEILEENIEDTDHIKVVNWYESKDKLLENTKEKEGIMIKDKTSIYEEGKRSDNWLKLKFIEEEDFTVYGYTSKDRDVSALILGEEGKFIGRVNMAMPNDAYQKWKDRLEATRKEERTIEIPIDIKEDVFFVEPKFKAKIRFLEKTQNGLRFPVLKDLEVIK